LSRFACSNFKQINNPLASHTHTHRHYPHAV